LLAQLLLRLILRNQQHDKRRRELARALRIERAGNQFAVVRAGHTRHVARARFALLDRVLVACRDVARERVLYPRTPVAALVRAETHKQRTGLLAGFDVPRTRRLRAGRCAIVWHS
jgi:hypothetical protein